MAACPFISLARSPARCRSSSCRPHGRAQVSSAKPLNPLNLTEQQILDIPATRPERLFSGAAAENKQRVRRLRSKWHADTNPGVNPAVMERINALYDFAVELIDAGKWPGTGAITIKSVNGAVFKLQYLKSE